jgi:hypothetical protein
MADNEPQPGEGLTYSDNISLSWKPADHDLDQTHLAMVSASNEAFLRAVAILGDGWPGKELPESGSSLGAEGARLDLKLNLVLDLVATLVYRELDIPEARAVKVSSTGVAWRGESVPAPGEQVFLELYIQRGLPKPLCCYGEVVTSPEDYAAGIARARFVGLSGSAHDWLDKLIFRHHRREVAFRRAQDQEASNS